MTQNDFENLCDEFGVEQEFVEFVWAILQGQQKLPEGCPPLPALSFKPLTKRECALAIAVAQVLPPPEGTMQ